MPVYNKVLRSDMTQKQLDAVELFESGKFKYGEQEYEVNTLQDLYRANEWVMWQCRDDYRPGVIAAIQNTFVIPAFKRMAFGIIVSGGDVSDLDIKENFNGSRTNR